MQQYIDPFIPVDLLSYEHYAINNTTNILLRIMLSDALIVSQRWFRSGNKKDTSGILHKGGPD
jgi:hypothetical protein